MAKLRGVAEARARRGVATASRWSLAEMEHSSRRRSWTWRPWRARGLMASSRWLGHVEELRFGMVTAWSQRERWWRLGKGGEGDGGSVGKGVCGCGFYGAASYGSGGRASILGVRVHSGTRGVNREYERRGERAGARVRGCSGAGARGLATERWRRLSSRGWGMQLRVRRWVTGLSGMASRPAGKGSGCVRLGLAREGAWRPGPSRPVEEAGSWLGLSWRAGPRW